VTGIDTNILVYAHREDSERHGPAFAAVHDARIAALCLHHRVDELWSADRDFSRFPELRIRNPLVGES